MRFKILGKYCLVKYFLDYAVYIDEDGFVVISQLRRFSVYFLTFVQGFIQTRYKDCWTRI